MMADPPIYLPWLIAAIFILALAWAFWPSRQDRRVETIGEDDDVLANRPTPSAAALMDSGENGSILSNRITIKLEGDGPLFEMRGNGVISENNINGAQTRSATLSPPILPSSSQDGDVKTSIGNPNAFRVTAETGSIIDFTGAAINMENPSIIAHASGGSTVSFEGARIGTHYHHGREPFEMTSEVMAGVLRYLQGRVAVEIWAVGSSRSQSAVEALRIFLREQGVAVSTHTTGALSPPLSSNLEWRNASLYVNADI